MLQNLCSEQDALLCLWHEQCSFFRFPAQQDFGLPQLQRWLPHLAFITLRPTRAKRLLVQRSGLRVDAAHGTAAAGRFWEDLVPGKARDEALRPFYLSLFSGRPVCAQSSAGTFANTDRAKDVLILPCRSTDSGRNVGMFVAAVYHSPSAGMSDDGATQALAYDTPNLSQATLHAVF